MAAIAKLDFPFTIDSFTFSTKDDGKKIVTVKGPYIEYYFMGIDPRDNFNFFGQPTSITNFGPTKFMTGRYLTFTDRETGSIRSRIRWNKRILQSYPTYFGGYDYYMVNITHKTAEGEKKVMYICAEDYTFKANALVFDRAINMDIFQTGAIAGVPVYFSNRDNRVVIAITPGDTGVKKENRVTKLFNVDLKAINQTIWPALEDET